MPGAVRLKLDHAIADHLRTHRSRFYDLLRDDPAFAPWIGTHLGARGEKRLDRAIADVRRFQKQKLARKAAPSGRPADDADDFAPLDPVDHSTSGAQRLSTAGAAVLSYEELQARSRKRLRQLDRAIDACVNEDGEPVDPRLFAQLVKQEQAVQADSVQLSKSYYADLNTKDVVQGVLKRLEVELAANPERAAALVRDIDDVFRRANGLAAIKGNG
jgi:hypothetical protein